MNSSCRSSLVTHDQFKFAIEARSQPVLLDQFLSGKRRPVGSRMAFLIACSKCSETGIAGNILNILKTIVV